MKTTLPSPTKREADAEWSKTPYSNFIRYKPSGNYFGRVRFNGKLIRRSLETHVLTVATPMISDFLQEPFGAWPSIKVNPSMAKSSSKCKKGNRRLGRDKFA